MNLEDFGSFWFFLLFLARRRAKSVGIIFWSTPYYPDSILWMLWLVPPTSAPPCHQCCSLDTSTAPPSPFNSSYCWTLLEWLEHNGGHLTCLQAVWDNSWCIFSLDRERSTWPHRRANLCSRRLSCSSWMLLFYLFWGCYTVCSNRLHDCSWYHPIILS